MKLTVDHVKKYGTGTIYYLKESGSNEEILSSGSSIKSLLFFAPKEQLIILTEAQIMGHFRVSADGDLNEINKVHSIVFQIKFYLRPVFNLLSNSR